MKPKEICETVKLTSYYLLFLVVFYKINFLNKLKKNKK